MPVAAAILVALKMSAAAWIAIRLDRSRLIEPRALVTTAAAWLAAVLALYAVFAWIADTPRHPTVCAPAHRHPGDPADPALGGAAGPRLESAPVMATTMERGSRTIVMVLILISLPMLLAVVEAVSYFRHNRNNGSIVSSGQEREYILYVPKSYDPAKPAPLVISLHGGSVWPAVQRDMSRWNTVADNHGVIVAYPMGRGIFACLANEDSRTGAAAGRALHRGPDRHDRGGLQHRPDTDLRGRAVQWRGHGVRAVLRPRPIGSPPSAWCRPRS